MAKRKKSELQKAKDRAWVWFSRYIRLRDCLESSGFPDQGQCATCEEWFPFSELEAGHFVPGRSKYILFDERGVHAQCGRCNHKKPYGLDGNLIKYYPFMLKKYGQEIVDELTANKYKSGKWTIPELDDIKDEYKVKYEKLNASH